MIFNLDFFNMLASFNSIMLLKTLQFSAILPLAYSQSCNPVKINNGTVCECTGDYCDSVTEPWVDAGQIAYTVSSQAGLRWQQTTEDLQTGSKPDFSDPDNIITIQLGEYNHEKVPRPVPTGFGGLLDDATAINIQSTNADVYQNLMNSLFDTSSGLGYSYVRTTIGCSEMSDRLYTYQDDSNDKNLNQFALQPEDLDAKIPVMKDIRDKFQADDNLISFISSPWTAPTWMKTNNAYLGNGQIIGHPYEPTDRKGYFASWALYFVKYIQAYQENGVDINAITMQNLPSNGMSDKPYLPIPQTAWNPADEGVFLRDYLQPAFDEAGIDVNVIACDDYVLELPNSPQIVYGINYDNDKIRD